MRRAKAKESGVVIPPWRQGQVTPHGSRAQSGEHTEEPVASSSGALVVLTPRPGAARDPPGPLQAEPWEQDSEEGPPLLAPASSDGGEPEQEASDDEESADK